MFPLRSRILAEAINTKILIKNYPDSPHSHSDSPYCHPDSLHSQPDSLHSHPDSCIYTLISRIPNLVLCVITLIPHVPTLIPRISIIHLILFFDSPFQLSQRALVFCRLEKMLYTFIWVFEESWN